MPPFGYNFGLKLGPILDLILAKIGPNLGG